MQNSDNTPSLHQQSGPSHLVVLLATLLGTLAFSGVLYLHGYTILPQGPAIALAEATKSLWHSGSLSPQYYREVFESARTLSASSGSEVWQDVFALSADQRLLPKHSIFTVFVALPFYALFGTVGFWVCQQVFLLWLVKSLYRLIERVGGGSMPLTTVTVACCGTPLLLHSFALGYDLQATALIIGGLNLMLTRPVLGGFVLGLSVFVRPTHIILAAPLCFAMPSHRARIHVWLSLAGLSLSLLAFATLNYVWWGSPFLTAYQRIPHFAAGELVLRTNPVGFDFTTFITDWSDKLFGKSGLLWCNAALLLFPWVFKRMLAHPERRFLLACLGIGLGYALYIFSYPMWDVSGPGNRFLLPSISLYLIGLLAVVEQRCKPLTSQRWTT